MLLTPGQYFRLQGRKPRKRFGQHFLSQSGTAEKIVASADLDQNDVAVEVGPGLGALTRHILHRVNRLHLVELDRDLAGYLKENLEPGNCRVEVHQQDVMTFDFSSLSRREGRRMVLLGNLPYNISSPLSHPFVGAGRRKGRVHGAKGSGGAHCRGSGRKRLRRPVGTPGDLFHGTPFVYR